MRIDRSEVSPDPATVAAAAGRAETDGAGGLWVSETAHDPFICAALAISRTQSITIGTAIAVAFARSPMTTALAGWDLNALSGGRFVLGLGSQIRAHIERRYSMQWSDPVPRMREYLQALQAIWESWQEGSRLNFRGTYYNHTLMTPSFSPGANSIGAPPVFLAAVGEQMLRLAGEAADGLVAHPMCSVEYLQQVALPAINDGLTRSSRARDRFQIFAMPLVVSGASPEAREQSAKAAKKRIAFYASTPAYRAVLALHGWEDLQTELNSLSKRGGWEEMGALIDDDMLDAFALVADARDDLASKAVIRFADLVDVVALPSESDSPGLP